LFAHARPASLTRRQALRSAGRAGAAVAVAALLARVPLADAHDASMNAAPADQLRAALRKLWEDHITWTRLFIVSAAAGLPDLDPTTQRLLQNQADLGNAIKPYYGDAAGDQLAALLRDHL